MNDIELDEADIRLLRFLADGLSVDSIAPLVHMSARTVRRRVRALCLRAGVDTPIQVVVEAIRQEKL